MANLQIKIDDDKKQKWQSFAASVNLELPHLYSSEVEAYGADEKEATENLMAMLSDIATDVNKKLKKLDSTAPPDNDSDSYVQEYSDHFIFTNKKTGKETKVDK